MIQEKIKNKIVAINTPLGLAHIEASGKKICRILISEEKDTPSAEIPEELEEVVLQLNQYFHGSRKDFDLELNPEGTDFQKKVWKELQKIPFGKTASYLDIAKKLGDKNAVRAVAAANGKNPLWVIIPCHRVIGSDGSLTGYTGGIWRKKWLLEHENPFKQQSLF